MSVHNWTLVDAGTFHDFHTGWLIHLKETFNGGLLPSGYYAMSEQHAGPFIVDVLTLQDPLPAPLPPVLGEGGLAVVETPPKVRRKLSVSATSRRLRRTLTIRHVSGHRIVALLEIVSLSNKDRVAHVAEFADKAETALLRGINFLLVDLFAPGPHDPQGMHGSIWERFDNEPYSVPANEPLTLASYVAGPLPEAYVEHLAVGMPLIDMPLFLNPDNYINVPLEATYLAAYQGMPAFWREVLEGVRQLPQ